MFSTERIIELINKKRLENGYNIRTINDYITATFKNFDYTMNKHKLGQLYDSDDFFKGVKFNEELIKALEENNEELFDYFNWAFVTKGSEKNHIKKSTLIYSHPFFYKHKKEIDYYGLEMKENKSSIFMMNGIQIDDMTENLKDTDASLKILFKNNKENELNRINTTRLNLQNLYIVNDTKELIDILKFIKVMEETKKFNFFEGIED